MSAERQPIALVATASLEKGFLPRNCDGDMPTATNIAIYWNTAVFRDGIG